MKEEPKNDIAGLRKVLGKKQNSTITPKLKKVDKINVQGTLSDFLDNVKEADFNCSSISRIDGDLHEVFQRLKKKTGIKMENLVNGVLKNFVEQNAKEIKDLLKKNKYL